MTRNLLKLLTAFALSGVAAISMASDSGFIADELRAVHSQLTDTRRWVDSDIRANLSHRWKSAPRRLADSGLRFAESELEGLPWVTDVDLHRITRNGNFLAGFGVSGVGLLWTGESHALGFQPSGEWLDGSGDDFASFGIFGRKAVGDWGVVGANVFGDYASDSEFGEFSRWSLGADFQSELADLRGNWYAEGTGFRSRRIQGGEVFAYSPSGVDAELNLRWRGVSEWTGFAEYEKWDGRFGKADTRDVGFGLTYRPLGDGILAGLEVDAGYFTALGADDRLDLRLAYSRVLGGDNRATERNFGFGVQSALVAPVARERKIEIAEATIWDPEFFDAEPRFYRERDGMWVADNRPFLLNVKNRCTLVFDWPRTTYAQKTSAELHEQAENPAKFDDLCGTINKTADIRTLDSNGNLATHRAVSGAATDNLKLLIAAGVRVTATNTAGNTPLDLAQAKHRATGNSALRETLSTIAMVIRASGGECATESGALCAIAYDALYEDSDNYDFYIIDAIAIPSNFQGSSIYQLHHPEYGKMTLIRSGEQYWDPRITVTSDGEVRIREGAILKSRAFEVEGITAGNENLPHLIYVDLVISVSVIPHSQPWNTPPIRKVAPNYTGAYFTITAAPPSGRLGYSFGPGERAAYRIFGISNSRIKYVHDGMGQFNLRHIDSIFTGNPRSYSSSNAHFLSDIETATWQHTTAQFATANQRLAATYENAVFAVSVNQAIGQGESEIYAVHMFVDPYEFAHERQTLNFTIAIPSIPSLAVYTVGANHLGVVATLSDDDLRNPRYEVIGENSKLALNASGHLRVNSVIDIGKEATLSAKFTSPDLLGTLTITAKVLSRCTATTPPILATSKNLSSQYQRKGKALNQAARDNDIAEVCRLIGQGADPNYRTFAGYRPLGRGAQDGGEELARVLASHGANPNYVGGSQEYSPLHLAVKGFNYAYAEVLLQYRANISMKTAQDNEAIHEVGGRYDTTEDEFYDFYDLLLRHGAKINAIGNNRRTPLMEAARFGVQPEKIRALLRHGANKDLRDSNFMTACDYGGHKQQVREALGC